PRPTACYNAARTRASRLLVRITFEKIELETSSTFQACKYDNLTVMYMLNGARETGCCARGCVAAALNTLAVQSGWLAGTQYNRVGNVIALMAATFTTPTAAGPARQQPLYKRFFHQVRPVQLEGSYHSPGQLVKPARVFCKLRRPIQLVSQGSATWRLRTDSSVGTGFRVTWFAADSPS
uniref:Polyprotein n=1 Tax=Macrostomum lignano TaxID=282301 RepID=A0A1I8FJM5_9PLAT